MTKISPRQLLFFLACIAPVGKLVLLPSALVNFSGNDLLIPALLNYALQTAVIFFVLLLSRHNQTLYELLENTFGKIAAKIVMSVFSLFLLYAALLPLLEQKLFVQSVFYDTLPSNLAFAPFFLFAAYLCFQPLAAFGRTWDILAPLSVVGYLGIIVLSAGEASYGALLPVGASGATGILGGTAFTMSWFFDSALVLMLMGRFEYKKGLAWKSAVCYLIGGIAVIFFLAVYYGIFSEIAIRQLFAFSKISKYFSGITVLGRIDYLFIYSLALVMAFYCALPLQAGTQCLKDAFGESTTLKWCTAIGFNAAIFALSVISGFSFLTTLTLISKTLFWIFPVFCIALPLLALLLRRKREKNR